MVIHAGGKLSYAIGKFYVMTFYISLNVNGEGHGDDEDNFYEHTAAKSTFNTYNVYLL